MAKQVITDARILVGGYDLSGTSNSVALEYGADAVPDTCFGAGTRTAAGGLKTVSMGAEGYWQSEPDASLFSSMGVAGNVVTVYPVPEAAYSFQSMVGEYSPSGSIGEMYGFTMSAAAQNLLFRGSVFGQGTATAGGGGTWGGSWRNSGGVLAAQRAHISLHVLSVTGSGSVQFLLLSGPTSGATGGDVTTRHTFGGVSEPGSEYASVAGPVTDTWWRLFANFSGSATAADYVVIFGIQ